MLGYNSILILGILLRSRFINMLVTSYFSIIAILVIYLSAQNPDLYREKRVRMFKNGNLKTIVEGIETEEMYLRMIEMGCDYEQGYYFSMPLPPEEFVEYLQTVQTGGANK